MTQTLRPTQADAQAAYEMHAYGESLDGTHVLHVGEGEDRSAYLVNGVVYKVGRRDSANVADHDALSAARAAGFAWAPATALLSAVGEFGEFHPVLAMPYLVDDDSDVPDELLAQFRLETGGQVDRIGGNWVAIAGRPWVIDGCTLA